MEKSILSSIPKITQFSQNVIKLNSILSKIEDMVKTQPILQLRRLAKQELKDLFDLLSSSFHLVDLGDLFISMNKGLADHNTKKAVCKFVGQELLQKKEYIPNTKLNQQLSHSQDSISIIRALEEANKENTIFIHKLYDIARNGSQENRDKFKAAVIKKSELLTNLGQELEHVRHEVLDLIEYTTEKNEKLDASDYLISKDPILDLKFFVNASFANEDQKYNTHPNWPAYKYKDRITAEDILNYANPMIIDNFKQLLTVNKISGLQSMLGNDIEVSKGYIEHVKGSVFYGPFYFSEEYVICQISSDGSNMLGWEISIERERIVIGERKGRSWVGYHLEIGPHNVQEIDNSKGSFVSLRNWVRQFNGALKLQNN